MAQPHARVFDMTGRVMRGWVVVAAEGIADDAALGEWVQRGADYALIAAAEVGRACTLSPRLPKTLRPGLQKFAARP